MININLHVTSGCKSLTSFRPTKVLPPMWRAEHTSCQQLLLVTFELFILTCVTSRNCMTTLSWLSA